MMHLDLAAIATGEHMVTKYTGDSESPSPARIALLAYALYEMNGRQEGRDLDDWLSAERQLAEQTGAPAA